jgi:hypothetical protein
LHSTTWAAGEGVKETITASYRLDRANHLRLSNDWNFTMLTKFLLKFSAIEHRQMMFDGDGNRSLERIARILLARFSKVPT